MIEKVVRKFELDRFSEVKENLAFWLSLSPEERVASVERLRIERHGSATRLQRSLRVVQRA
jgi:hypothetical protein